MSKKILLMLLAIVMLFSTVLVACTADDEPNVPADKDTDANGAEDDDDEEDDAETDEKVYRFTDNNDVTSLNPHNQAAYLVGDIHEYTGSRLYRKVPGDDGKSYKIIGDIAEGEPYLADEDGYVWHVKLRQDATWQNGEAINADTFIYSFKMLLDPKLVNPIANFMYDNFIDIKNGFEYFSQEHEGAEAVDWEDVGINKVDDYTLEFITTQRYTANLVMEHLLQRSNYPVYEPYYEAGMNESRTVTTYGTTLDEYMGNGPYILESWIPDATRTYVKNEDHWLADYFKIGRVEVRITPDRNARVQLFENGEIDNMQLDVATLERYIDDPRTNSYLSLACTHVDINSENTENPILKSLNFRKAIYYGIDRETVCNLVGFLPSGYYINHQAGAFPEEAIMYRDTPEAQAIAPENYGYDPEKAVEYFEAALKETGEDSLVVDMMLTEENENNKLIAEYLQQSLAELFGEDRFEMTLRFVPASSHSAMQDWKSDPNIFEMTFDAWSSSLSRIYPYAAFQYFVSDYASRPNSFITERFDEKFKALTTEEVRLDPQLMVEMTAELEEIYIEDVINVPIGQQRTYVIFSDRMDLPVTEYVPNFGYGTMYADIVK